MKHNNIGFTVLEMIISIMISAILLTAGLTIYNQISTMASRINRITHTDSQMLILHQRLSADLNGLTPLWFSKKTYTDLKKSNEPKAKNQNNENTPQGSAKNNNFLFAQSNQNNLEILTFATTNAMQTFSNTPARCVRVIYILKEEEKNKSMFQLMRKQDNTINSEFDIEQLKQGIFYTIADHITQCKIEYGFIKKSDNNQSKFTFVSEWGNDKAKEEQKQEDKKPDMPDIIKLTITVQPDNQPTEQKYEIFCHIPTCHATTVKPFAQKRHEKEKEEHAKQQTAKEATTTPATPETSALPTTGNIVNNHLAINALGQIAKGQA